MTTRSWLRKLFSRKPRPLPARPRTRPGPRRAPAGDGADLIATVKAANDETAHPGPDTINLTHSTDKFSAPDSCWCGPDALPAISSAITSEGNGSGGIVLRDGSTVTSSLFRVRISESVCLSASSGICSLCSITTTHPPNRVELLPFRSLLSLRRFLNHRTREGWR
jgi:hypothetical protein